LTFYWTLPLLLHLCYHLITSDTLSYSRETEWYDRVEDLFIFLRIFGKSWKLKTGINSNFFRVSGFEMYRSSFMHVDISMQTFHNVRKTVAERRVADAVLSNDSLRGGSVSIYASRREHACEKAKLVDRFTDNVTNEISQNRSVICRHMNLWNL
jgi:hypothetical protein